MSALRQRLTHPGTYLALLGLIAAAVVVDGLRPPDRQLGGRAYIGLVRGYQAAGSPRIARLVQCRFQPTCSRYSIQAVRRYGLPKGFALTLRRLWRCRSATPAGTVDPVP